MCFSNVFGCFFIISKLVYSFESLSIKPMQNNGVVYSTEFALLHDTISQCHPMIGITNIYYINPMWNMLPFTHLLSQLAWPNK